MPLQSSGPGTFSGSLLGRTASVGMRAFQQGSAVQARPAFRPAVTRRTPPAFPLSCSFRAPSPPEPGGEATLGERRPRAGRPLSRAARCSSPRGRAPQRRQTAQRPTSGMLLHVSLSSVSLQRPESCPAIYGSLRPNTLSSSSIPAAHSSIRERTAADRLSNRDLFAEDRYCLRQRAMSRATAAF